MEDNLKNKMKDDLKNKMEDDCKKIEKWKMTSKNKMEDEPINQNQPNLL